MMDRALKAIAVVEYLILQKPLRGGERARATLERRRNWYLTGALDPLVDEGKKLSERRYKSRMERLQTEPPELSPTERVIRIIQMFRAGDTRKAANLLSHGSSEQKRPAPWSPDMKKKLERLHPRATLPLV